MVFEAMGGEPGTGERERRRDLSISNLGAGDVGWRSRVVIWRRDWGELELR